MDQRKSVVIDAGYHPEKCGDIDLDEVEGKCSAYTPVPGGVGPMTINTLLMQTVEACEKRFKNDLAYIFSNLVTKYKKGKQINHILM
ncbi:MAG: hypothetical protein CM1200mP12_23480 [Gammaproteobacteria bacterium]|nr:MAG: hypothetical protein CM1200mP12_23480 [Gammaproteobacteria bacterium]